MKIQDMLSARRKSVNSPTENIYVPDLEARRQLVTPITSALVQQVEHKFKKGVRFYGKDGRRVLPADQ